jgi:DNA helicase-2/ATP-dependent DNA helicase PcrA
VAKKKLPPWLQGVKGQQVRPLITEDASVLRVQAGPGTGKTFGLRKRVLRVLHPEGAAVPAEKVLVCSFNRVTANDLRAEISAELEPHGLAPPRVTTVHSLCASIVGAGPRFLLPHEEEVMTFDVLAEHPALKKKFETQPKLYAALREHEAGAEDHPDLKAAVNQWLAQHQGSLVGDVVRRLSAGLSAGDYEGGTYEHVIVDEFQDLTAVEAEILVQLRSKGGQFVALGDRKQSIYAFRGNDERGLDALPDLVAEAVADMPMDECQRCHSEIVSLSNAVMALEGEPLVDIRGPGAEIHHVYWNTPAAEAKGMAKQIVRVFKERPKAEHLVLVTRRRWGYDLRNAIRAIDPDVVVETSFAEDALETWPAREAFILLEILGAPDAISLRDWVAYQPSTEGKGFKASQRNAPSYWR